MKDTFISKILTISSISNFGIIGAIKFNLLSFNMIGETLFLWLGGILSSLYLAVKLLNEIKKYHEK